MRQSNAMSNRPGYPSHPKSCKNSRQTENRHIQGYENVIGSMLPMLAFLRIGEAVSPGKGQFKPNTHLGVDNIEVDDTDHPTVLEVHLNQSI